MTFFRSVFSSRFAKSLANHPMPVPISRRANSSNYCAYQYFSNHLQATFTAAGKVGSARDRIDSPFTAPSIASPLLRSACRNRFKMTMEQAAAQVHLEEEVAELVEVSFICHACSTSASKMSLPAAAISLLRCLTLACIIFCHKIASVLLWWGPVGTLAHQRSTGHLSSSLTPSSAPLFIAV